MYSVAEYRKAELDASDATKSGGDGSQTTELSGASEIAELYAADTPREVGDGIPHELAAPTFVHELETFEHGSI